MERHMPKPGEKYMHFKGNAYQILCVASHFETKEKMVVYQALYGAFEIYVKPLEMFMEEVDHRKYPQAKQAYCFECMEQMKAGAMECKAAESSKVGLSQTDAFEPESGAEVSENGREAKGQMETETIGTWNAAEEQANPALLAFLDADTMEQKYQVLKTMGNTITDRLIDDFAVVLDLVIPEGDIDARYQQLLSSLRTLQKFETTRFRRG